jgi:hypothetical protein
MPLVLRRRIISLTMVDTRAFATCCGVNLAGVYWECASAFPKTAQADAFGAEAENHFIDDGKDEGVRYLLWGEPGRGLLGGGGLLLHFPNTGVGEWKSFLGSALLRG